MERNSKVVGEAGCSSPSPSYFVACRCFAVRTGAIERVDWLGAMSGVPDGLWGLWRGLKHFISDPSKLVHKLFPESFGRCNQCRSDNEDR